MKPEYRYLALGDSYTIGEAVEGPLSFPHQLAALLSEQMVLSPAIIAKTGWTTDELLEALEKQPAEGIFDLVTLLIGVNNQYRGYPLGSYRKEFSQLLATALELVGGKKERVIVISIPDWGVTPFASTDKRSAAEIGAQIDCFNEVNREEAEKTGIRYISVTEGSRKAAVDHELTAADGLHPSAKMYRQWAEQLALAVKQLLPAG
jgi:lysophospholipase L1-like esterase